MADGGLPDALPPEVEPVLPVQAFAGEGRAVAVADLHAVPVVEIGIVDGAVAHDAAERDLLLHEVRRAPAAALAELARPRVVAPAASLQVDYPALVPGPGARVEVVSRRCPVHAHCSHVDGGLEDGDGHHEGRRRGSGLGPPPPAAPAPAPAPPPPPPRAFANARPPALPAFASAAAHPPILFFASVYYCYCCCGCWWNSRRGSGRRPGGPRRSLGRPLYLSRESPSRVCLC